MDARILVINDDKAMRALLTLALNNEGWEVLGFPYAGIQLAALEQLSPDLIILDFIAATANGPGWELLQLLKMDDRLAKIPILVSTTAFELSSEVRSYLLTRYISVVPKPFELDAFRALVQKTLMESRQAGTLFSSELRLPILVVEDTETLLDDIILILELEGYPVVTACNGRVALDRVSRADHCLILLDIDMPVMNGFEFLYAYNWQLRPHSPVVIVSGETNIRQHVLPAFVVDVLPKPFEVTPLLRLVRNYARPILQNPV